MKLPSRFKVPTPLGSYNPDWAAVIEEQGHERLTLSSRRRARLTSRYYARPSDRRSTPPSGTSRRSALRSTSPTSSIPTSQWCRWQTSTRGRTRSWVHRCRRPPNDRSDSRLRCTEQLFGVRTCCLRVSTCPRRSIRVRRLQERRQPSVSDMTPPASGGSGARGLGNSGLLFSGAAVSRPGMHGFSPTQPSGRLLGAHAGRPARGCIAPVSSGSSRARARLLAIASSTHANHGRGQRDVIAFPSARVSTVSSRGARRVNALKPLLSGHSLT